MKKAYTRWTDKDTAQLKKLLRRKDLLAKDIAEMMNKRPGTVCYRIRKMGISAHERARQNGKLGQSHSKHRHLAEKAMRYFLTHSFEQTQKKFGLSATEFKSLMTRGYMDPKLTHLRKDTRRNDVWSHEEKMFLIRASGLQSREWIARKLKRGTKHSVKEEAVRMKFKTRYMNGIPLKWAKEMLGGNVELRHFRVKAGPSSLGIEGRMLLVPWVELYAKAKRSTGVPEHLVSAIGAMAKFQKRVHRTRGVETTLEAIEKIIRRR